MLAQNKLLLVVLAVVLVSVAAWAAKEPVKADDPITLIAAMHADLLGVAASEKAMYADLLCVAASEFHPYTGGVEFTYNQATNTILVTYLPPTRLEPDMFTVVDQLAGNAPINEILKAAGVAPMEELIAAAAARDNARRSPNARHLPLPARSPPVRSDPVVIGKAIVLTPHGISVLDAHKASMQEQSEFKLLLLLSAFQRNVSPAVRFTSAGF